MPDINCFNGFWKWCPYLISHTEAISSKAVLSLRGQAGLAEFGKFFRRHLRLWLPSIYHGLLWFSCWEAHESSSLSQQDLYPVVACVILAWNTVLKCPSRDCVCRTWPQRWSSDSSAELPLYALSESLPVASWIGPCMRVLFHLLSHFRRQRHRQGWEKSVRIPEDPPIFQVCLSLAEKWLKILSGACQSVVSASFF